MRFIYMKRIIFFFILLIAIPVFAQVDTNLSMYWAVPTQFNPAAAGSDSLMRIIAYDRMQWVGLKDKNTAEVEEIKAVGTKKSNKSPQTFYISADMPLQIAGTKQGVGVSALKETIDSLTTTRLGAQYAYSIKLKRKSSLTLGAQIGMLNRKFDPSAIKNTGNTTTTEGSKGDMLLDEESTDIDFALGAFYQKRVARNELYLGLSAQKSNTYYFLAGGNIPVSRTLYIVQPSLFVRAAKGHTQVEATLRATYNQRFWGGASYRYDDAVVLMAGVDIQHFRLGYAYDIGISGLAKESHGSHEILASYFLKLDMGKKKARPSKSIRIL